MSAIVRLSLTTSDGEEWGSCMDFPAKFIALEEFQGWLERASQSDTRVVLTLLNGQPVDDAGYEGYSGNPAAVLDDQGFFARWFQ